MKKQKYEEYGIWIGKEWELNKGLDPSTLIGKEKEEDMSTKQN